MEQLKHYFPELSERQIELFELHQRLFLDWNQKINLISRKDTDHFITNHILHSLSVAKFVKLKPHTRILDVGTGGGFPGVPLAIYFPEVKFKLVDSIGKKIKVVNDIVSQLGLSNVTASHERVENLNEKFDFVVSRAVAPIARIKGWVHHLIQDDGKNNISNGYIFLKGGELRDEMEEGQMKCKTVDISDYFDEGFFETKKILYCKK